MEPLTEHRPVNGPVVYGFLRLAKNSAARQTALVGVLAEYCRSHELVLGAVFIERGSTTCAHSAAFTGLLDVLDMPDVYGVVLPSDSHLGPKSIAAERRRHITGSGGRLMLVRGSKTTRRPPERSRRRIPSSAPALDAET
ncbi:hypothetical protein OIU91_09825 [Streptomyces sp. NBC_01456]|uniref:hypothetical protein n=1 Tax=unclassified Streptomyces TaxID=2593676 RepID=UPI002E3068C2|nr:MULTISPECIES: hypothetical protein [unclassified Streptomyces]